MRSAKLFIAVLFTLSVTACGGGGGGGSLGPAPAPAPSSSEGAAGAPVTITMPHNGQVDSVNDSYYTFTTSATTQTITLTNLTSDVDPQVYTNANFTTQNLNWTCTWNSGTTTDTCTAATPVPAGTVLYISALNFTSAGATYTLGVTTTSAVTGSEGAAGAPLTITMPHNGQVDSVNDSFYSFSTTGTTQTITLTNLTNDVDPLVYTDANFTTLSTNWTCTWNSGTTADSCTATTPAPAGTVLFIRAVGYTSLGATYTLGVTTTTPPPATGSEGAAGAPLTISMPHNGQIAVITSFADSYYSYTTVGTVGTINLFNLTDDVDITVSTNATFNTQDSNWSCTMNVGTTADSCTAITPVPAGTVLYIRAWSYVINPAGATYTLSVAP